MKTEWQECFRPDTDRNRRPKICISLNVRGDIAINAAAWNRMGRQWFAVLMFDAKTRRIGLRTAEPGEPNAFPLRMTRTPGARVIRAGRLMKQFDIVIAETVGFPDLTQEGRVWVLDLNTAVVPEKVRKHWRKQRRNDER